MSGAWNLAWRNLLRNRRRNAATALALVLGFAGLVLIGGYATRIERFLRTNTVYLQHVGHLTVYKRDGLYKSAARPAAYSLSAAEQETIRAVLAKEPGVELVGRYLGGMGLAGNGCRSVPFRAVGVEPATERRLLSHPEVLSASPELARPIKGRTLGEVEGIEGAAGLSAGLAQLLAKPNVRDELAAPPSEQLLDCEAPDLRARLAEDANVQLVAASFDGSLSAVDAEIVNLFHTPLAEMEDGTVIADLAALQRLYGTDAVTWMSVYLSDHREARALAARLREALRAAGLEVDVYAFDDDEVGAYYVGTRQMLGSIVAFIGALVAAVAGLSVLNAMTLTLIERARELGTFRSLGFTRGQLRGLLVREALLLGAVSVAAGTMLALAVAAAVNGADVRFSPPGVPGTIQLSITPTTSLCGGAAALFLALSACATWIAARRRTSEKIVDLLTANAS